MFLLIKYWLPVCLWMLVIFTISSDMGSAANTSRYLVPFLHWLNPTISQTSVEQIHFIVRKGGHLSEYAVLATLLFFALRRSLLPGLQGACWKSAALSLFISAIYAAGDEFHQSFVGSRTAAFSDVMIDTSGALIALCFIIIIGSFWRKRVVLE
jgi:VanZ family protein